MLIATNTIVSLPFDHKHVLYRHSFTFWNGTANNLSIMLNKPTVGSFWKMLRAKVEEHYSTLHTSQLSLQTQQPLRRCTKNMYILQHPSASTNPIYPNLSMLSQPVSYCFLSIGISLGFFEHFFWSWLFSEIWRITPPILPLHHMKLSWTTLPVPSTSPNPRLLTLCFFGCFAWNTTRSRWRRPRNEMQDSLCNDFPKAETCSSQPSTNKLSASWPQFNKTKGDN